MNLLALIIALMLGFVSHSQAEILDLDIINYQDLIDEKPETLDVLAQALLQKGIVGVKGIPDYEAKVTQLIEAARVFARLPEEVKEAYAPAPGDIFLGYERGKEKFQRPDGSWVIDNLKVSYYALVPDTEDNMWPTEMDLQTPFLELGLLMSKVAQQVMEQIGLLGPTTGIYVNEETFHTGRMLHYCQAQEIDNPLWCGAHFDHGMFTALIPAFYFVDGIQVPEPPEAGLFVKAAQDTTYKKVVSDDPNVLLFQVGEFGQLATNDAIRATSHRVQKASGPIERFTMALFMNAPLDTVIHSQSELTQDTRYGGEAGDPCTYEHWHRASSERYLVTDASISR